VSSKFAATASRAFFPQLTTSGVVLGYSARSGIQFAQASMVQPTTVRCQRTFLLAAFP